MTTTHSDNGSSVAAAYRPLIRVRGLLSLPILPLGNVHTWLMHWDHTDQRTMPCVMNGCDYCRRFVTRRPMSYQAVAHLVHGGESARWVPSILEVPLSTGMELNDKRGLMIGLKRQRARGPILIGSFTTTSPYPTVDGFDIVPPLMRLWRLPGNAQLRLLNPEEWSMWNVLPD